MQASGCAATDAPTGASRPPFEFPDRTEDPPKTLPPLCIDLDGTLLKTDTLWETTIAHLKAHPWKSILLPFWLQRGRAHLKQRLASGVNLDCASLPYNTELLDYLRDAHSAGRELVLVSGCDSAVGAQVAQHLGFFSEVITSDGRTNVKGHTKARILNDRFGERGFDYVGNEHADFPVWEAARERLVANAPRAVSRRLAELSDSVVEFAPQRSRLPALVRALRCHQWSKNILVFLPLIAGHAYLDPRAVGSTVAMFVAWCFVASGIYVSNDLLDLEADRRHPTKRSRPLASGDLPLPVGLLLAPCLLLAGLSVAALISPACAAALVIYAVAATAYSFHLKKRSLVDVFTLASLFTIRVVGGGLASGCKVTDWLLAFAGFLFLGLAFLKRCSELSRIKALGRTHLGFRGYGVIDLPVLQMFGVASAFLAILVLALYISSPVAQTHYFSPSALWAVAPCMLLWLCRLWLATARGQMDDDPILYSLKDRVSWVIGFLILGAFVAATYGHFQ
jgi:4-hydroxybenzoate polyprenyltransferase/phosphoserine phosphatase